MVGFSVLGVLVVVLVMVVVVVLYQIPSGGSLPRPAPGTLHSKPSSVPLKGTL